MTRFQVSAQQQNEACVGIIRGRAIIPLPQVVAEPRAGGTDVGMAVMTVDPPRFQDAIPVTFKAGASHMIHDFILTPFAKRFSDTVSNVFENLMPIDTCPFSFPSFSCTF